MNSNVSILAEIPEELHFSLKNYLETHPHWGFKIVSLRLHCPYFCYKTTTDSHQRIRKTIVPVPECI